MNNNAPSKVLSVDEFLELRQEVLQVLKQSDTPLTETLSAPGDDAEAPPGEEPAGDVVVAIVSYSCIPFLFIQYFSILGRPLIYSATHGHSGKVLNYIIPFSVYFRKKLCFQ